MANPLKRKVVFDDPPTPQFPRGLKPSKLTRTILPVNLGPRNGFFDFKINISNSPGSKSVIKLNSELTKPSKDSIKSRLGTPSAALLVKSGPEPSLKPKSVLNRQLNVIKSILGGPPQRSSQVEPPRVSQPLPKPSQKVPVPSKPIQKPSTPSKKAPPSSRKQISWADDDSSESKPSQTQTATSKLGINSISVLKSTVSTVKASPGPPPAPPKRKITPIVWDDKPTSSKPMSVVVKTQKPPEIKTPALKSVVKAIPSPQKASTSRPSPSPVISEPPQPKSPIKSTVTAINNGSVHVKISGKLQNLKGEILAMEKRMQELEAKKRRAEKVKRMSQMAPKPVQNSEVASPKLVEHSPEKPTDPSEIFRRGILSLAAKRAKERLQSPEKAPEADQEASISSQDSIGSISAIRRAIIENNARLRELARLKEASKANLAVEEPKSKQESVDKSTSSSKSGIGACQKRNKSENKSKKVQKVEKKSTKAQKKIPKPPKVEPKTIQVDEDEYELVEEEIEVDEATYRKFYGLDKLDSSPKRSSKSPRTSQSTSKPSKDAPSSVKSKSKGSKSSKSSRDIVQNVLRKARASRDRKKSNIRAKLQKQARKMNDNRKGKGKITNGASLISSLSKQMRDKACRSARAEQRWYAREEMSDRRLSTREIRPLIEFDLPKSHEDQIYRRGRTSTPSRGHSSSRAGSSGACGSPSKSPKSIYESEEGIALRNSILDQLRVKYSRGIVRDEEEPVLIARRRPDDIDKPQPKNIVPFVKGGKDDGPVVVKVPTEEEGIDQMIHMENYGKGQLMAIKMGFKPGTGLGKNKQGIRIPIQPSNIKINRDKLPKMCL